VIRVTDGLGNRAEAAVTVRYPPPPVEISPSRAIVRIGGSVAFQASGGYPPYTWSVVSGGGSIDSAMGVYVAPLRPAFATVQVTDRQGRTDTATVIVSLIVW
jgi:hypothetical protein